MGPVELSRERRMSVSNCTWSGEAKGAMKCPYSPCTIGSLKDGGTVFKFSFAA